MDKRIKISSFWVWMIVLLLCLMGVLLLQRWVMHKVSVSVTPEVLNSGFVSKETEFTGEASKENNPKALTTDNKNIVVQTPPPLSMQPLQNQVEQQEVNPPTVIPINAPINAPMTDQQILKGIQQQNQIQQTIQQITAKRDAAAVEVMRNTETAQSQSTNNQQIIPSDSPESLPPDDVVAKLKSHQLTAH